MGVEYDEKSRIGYTKMQKQQEKEQRRRSKKAQQAPRQEPNESRPLTLDMITDPNK